MVEDEETKVIRGEEESVILDILTSHELNPPSPMSMSEQERGEEEEE